MTYLEASLSKKVTAPVKSSGVPILPAGIRETHRSFRSGFSSRILRVLFHSKLDASRDESTYKPCNTLQRETYKEVSTYPGLMQFTRILCLAHSTAKDDARWRTAALDALYGAWGCGTLTLEPDILPINTMLPGLLRLIKCLASPAAKR